MTSIFGPTLGDLAELWKSQDENRPEWVYYPYGHPDVYPPSQTVGSAQIITTNHTKPVAPQGWQCPKCQRIYAPTVDECEHCKPKLSRHWKIVTTTGGK